MLTPSPKQLPAPAIETASICSLTCLPRHLNKKNSCLQLHQNERATQAEKSLHRYIPCKLLNRLTKTEEMEMIKPKNFLYQHLLTTGDELIFAYSHTLSDFVS